MKQHNIVNHDWNKEKRMAKIAPMYIYATENVFGYYSKIVVKDKSVLTICGSGDQVINALFLGALKVVGFDLNSRSNQMLNLKVAAINTLSYKDFMNFFGQGNKVASFDHNLYNKVRVNLKSGSRKFFDSLYKKFSNNGKMLVESDNFRRRDFLYDNIQVRNKYLANEKSYFRCRKFINNNFEFIQSDINDIVKKAKNSKYDIINISNVPNYMVVGMIKSGLCSERDAVLKLCNLIKNLRKVTSKNGIIIYCSYSKRMYIYANISDTAKFLDTKESTDIIKKVTGFNIKRLKIRGIHPGTLDTVNILS